jgi:hypothetical protein
MREVISTYFVYQIEEQGLDVSPVILLEEDSQELIEIGTPVLFRRRRFIQDSKSREDKDILEQGSSHR